MISIIIAMFNGENFIIDTVNSVINQTIPVEIIIIDDCSTDNSYKLVNNIFLNDSRIKIYKNDENVGFCKTVNKGLELAENDYVLVLGQDDILLPNHCEIMLNYFDDRTSIVFCDFDLIDENGLVYEKINHCKHSDLFINDFYYDNALPSVGIIINKRILMDVGGYPENKSFPQYGEYHTWIRMSFAGRIVFCDEIRAKYRRHKNNMTNEFVQKKIKRNLNKYYSYCKKQILKNKSISFFDKIKVVTYMFYKTIKLYIFGR